jgi:aminoglycoside phosphotransferase (APT) family kinase protein
VSAERDAGPALAAGLARALADQDGAAPTVRVVGTASVGANRSTSFIEIDAHGNVTPAVVQLGGLQLDGVALPVEADCVRLAAEAGVPVAPPLAASDDRSYVGVPFQISRRVDGMTVPRHILRAVADHPDLGVLLTRQCGDALGRLHGIDPGRVPAEVRRVTEPTPTAAYLEYLRGVAGLVEPTPPVELGLRWLARHHPEPPTRPALVHSDLRNGNLIVDGERGLAAIIDWELTHVGDPMEDVAWLCLRCWRFREDNRMVGGFGDLADLREAYEAVGGTWRHDAFRWWSVARTLWWGLVLRLQAQAFVTGRSSSLVLAASGRRAAELEYDLLTLIRPR